MTAGRLPDLVEFMAARGRQGHGKFAYCACMRWRLTSAEFQRSTSEERQRRLMGLVRGGIPVGVLAYLDGEPVGWCSVAPRDTYAGLERFRALPRVDDVPVWSVACFFLGGRARGRGLSGGLLGAAVDYACASGAPAVEGYPVEPGQRLYTYMGSPALFETLGFADITEPGQTRRVVRRTC